MFRSWRLGKAFGIPVYLHPTFLLVPLLALTNQVGDGWFNALFMAALVCVVFGCVLLHEFGHALAARAFGIRTRDITLYPIGGVARLERMSERPAEELFIAVAGPAVNLAIVCLLLPVVVAAFVVQPVPLDDLTLFHLGDGLAVLAAKAAFVLAASNAGLMLFNLLPAFPSDGGRVFRALLAMAFDRVRATEIAAGVGVGMAGLIGLLFFVTWNPFILLVALFLVYAGRQEVLFVRRQAEAARLAALERERGPVWAWWRDGRPVEVYPGGAE